MKITKLEHACLVIELDNGEKLVIDPGEFAASLKDLSNITVVVITHGHGDHLNAKRLAEIVKANPKVEIFTVAPVAETLPKNNVEIVVPNCSCQASGFHLQFSGGEHAAVHASYPTGKNVGVMVNELLYYPGDSFTPPALKPKVLAVPTGAPWMKNSEAMDFLAEVEPEIAFGTHDGFLNDAGKDLASSLLSMTAESNKIDFRQLGTGDSISI